LLCCRLVLGTGCHCLKVQNEKKTVGTVRNRNEAPKRRSMTG
jgi:hypothetical protein